jgi:hypothetical protein
MYHIYYIQSQQGNSDVAGYNLVQIRSRSTVELAELSLTSEEDRVHRAAFGIWGGVVGLVPDLVELHLGPTLMYLFIVESGIRG